MATTINDIDDVPQDYDTTGKKVMIHDQSEPDETKQTGMIPIVQLFQYLVSKINPEDIAGLKTFIDGIKLPGIIEGALNSKPIIVHTDGTVDVSDGFVKSVDGMGPDPDTGNVQSSGGIDVSNLVDKTTDQQIAGAKTFLGDFTVKGAGQINSVIGALTSPATLFPTVAPLLHLTAVRTFTTLSAPTPGTQYQALHDAGYFIHIVINANQNDGTLDFPMGSDFTDWQTEFDTYIDAMYAYGVRGALVAIENEPNNILYHALNTDSVASYLAMLTHAATKCHSVGYFLTDGGMTGDALKFCLLDYVDNNGGGDYNSILYAEFTPFKQENIHNGTFQTNYSQQIDFINAVYAGLAATGADYANFHWYCSTNGSQPSSPVTTNIIYCKNWLETITGKLAITNEIGQHNAFDNYPAEILAALVGAGMKHIYWYSGDGGKDDGTNAVALTEPDGTMRSNGTGFSTYVQSLPATVVDILKVSGGKVNLPGMAGLIEKVLAPDADGNIVAVDKSMGDGTSQNLQSVTDAGNETTNPIISSGAAGGSIGAGAKDLPDLLAYLLAESVDDGKGEGNRSLGTLNLAKSDSRSAGIVTISPESITANRLQKIPDANGYYALTPNPNGSITFPDLPTLQDVFDQSIANEVQNELTYVSDDNGQINIIKKNLPNENGVNTIYNAISMRNSSILISGTYFDANQGVLKQIQFVIDSISGNISFEALNPQNGTKSKLTVSADNGTTLETSNFRIATNGNTYEVISGLVITGTGGTNKFLKLNQGGQDYYAALSTSLPV